MEGKPLVIGRLSGKGGMEKMPGVVTRREHYEALLLSRPGLGQEWGELGRLQRFLSISTGGSDL